MNDRKSACLVAAVLLAVMARAAPGQGDSIQLQRALDVPVELELADARIGEVFDKLHQVTGVKFVIDADAMDFLPYGDQTRLAVTLKNITLRKALWPMLARQGLTWEIDGQEIRIRPAEALERMCRRATFEELNVLGSLYVVRLAPTAEAGAVIEQLRKIEGLKKIKLRAQVDIDRDVDFKRAERALPGTAAVWLDMLCSGKDWTWYLWGDDIVIIDKPAQVRRQLERLVTLRYQNSSLVTVLLDLASKGRVRLTLAPGVMGYLPAATLRNFNLTMGKASIAQALEVISGATGLQFVRTAEGIRVEASDALKAEADPARRRAGRSRFFVKLSLPGPRNTHIEVFMRPEELPPDIIKMIEKAKEKFISRLRGEELDQVEE